LPKLLSCIWIAFDEKEKSRCNADAVDIWDLTAMRLAMAKCQGCPCMNSSLLSENSAAWLRSGRFNVQTNTSNEEYFLKSH